MRAIEHQSAEDFRETPYGRQLIEGFGRLRFVPQLEVEFRRYLGRQAQLAQRLAAVLLIVAVSGYLVVERFLLAGSDPAWLYELTLLRVLQLAPGLFILLLTVFHKRSRVLANRLFPLLLVLLGTVAARIDLHYDAIDSLVAFRYGAGLLVASSFFFLGVTFWRAVLTAAAIIALDVLMAALILTPSQLLAHWISVSYYVILLALGAISRYVHEYSQREQFLMRKLLGWVAQHDALSGLANRRSFDAALHQTLRQARREAQPLALLLLDLDDFKSYNDHLGHPAGDALIKKFADVLKGFARRPLDMAARVGGEEFALVLYHCDAESAQAIAEQLLAILEEIAMPHPGSPQSSHVTASIGIAILQPGQTVEQLYQYADSALYHAKQAGKNRHSLHGARRAETLQTV